MAGNINEDCSGCIRKGFVLDPEAVAALVDQIPISPELKADENLIAQRLSSCHACEAFKDEVLCAYCGCFIRFRTRTLKAYCPHPAGEKWPASSE